jgi:alkylated DNA repair dioxygenase AlkB
MTEKEETSVDQYLLFEEPTVEDLDLPGGNATVYKGFLTHAESLDYFSRLETGKEGIEWGQEKIRMFGQEHPIPRLTAWYGDLGKTYTYSGIKMEPLAWTKPLSELKDKISHVTNASFNSLLCNLYRNGQDCVSWHSDDEPELGPEPVIASLSLGGTRKFNMRRKDDKSLRRSVDLGSGDLLVMKGLTQQLWQHEIPRTTRKENQTPRINMTFRSID